MSFKILQNSVRCGKCKQVIWSSHVHDFKYCSCGSIAVDGGMEYLRRVGDIDNYKDLSISIDEKALKAVKDELERAQDTDRNLLGQICAVARVLKANGYWRQKKEPKYKPSKKTTSPFPPNFGAKY